jgi:hypothetical protein
VKITDIIKPNKKWLVASVLIVSACAGVATGDITTQPGEQIVDEAIPTPTVVQEDPTEDEAEEAGSTDTSSVPKVLPDFLPDEPPPSGAERQFTTNFSKHTIPYSDILSGGPPKDGIPAIDNPVFISVPEADQFLADVEPVIFLQIGGEARAYPLQIMTWHEIVNDVVGDFPVTHRLRPQFRWTGA